MVTWVLEQNVSSERCFDEMVEHFKANDIPYHIVRVIPFVHEIDGPVPKIEGPCVVYGSIGVQKVADREGWTPGTWQVPDDMEVIKKTWEGGHVHSNAFVTSMSKVVDECKSRGLAEFFIKPNSDTKEFAGMVSDVDKFTAWYKNMQEIGYLDNNDFDVLVSEPRNDLDMEFRVIIVDGMPVSGSMYRTRHGSRMECIDDKLGYWSTIWSDAMAHARKFKDVGVYAMDFATGEHGLQLIELNSFNSAGLYRCDVGKIINAVNKYVSKS